MTTELDDPHVEERLADLDRRLKSLEAVLWPTGGPRARTSSRPASVSPPQSTAPSHSNGRETASPLSARRPSDHSVSDLLGGRVLAWTGGAAMLTGIVLFLALAISRGWIGIDARVAL